MRKIVLFVLVLGAFGVFMSCNSVKFEYDQPAFNSPHSFVIDSFSMPGDLEDRIRLYNQTSKTGISFKVYAHDPKKSEWIAVGIGNLKEPGDTEWLNSDLSGDFDNYRYFAIEALDGKDYKYNFYKLRNDMHLTVTD